MRLDSLGEDEYYLKASQDCLITELESQQQERRALQVLYACQSAAILFRIAPEQSSCSYLS